MQEPSPCRRYGSEHGNHGSEKDERPARNTEDYMNGQRQAPSTRLREP